MYQQAEDMKTTENIDVNCIEPQYEYQGLVSTIHPPDYWRNLGSSKSRTEQEEEAGKRIILNLLNNQPSNSAVAFTDGSCSGVTYSFFPHTHFSPRKNEYILSFPPEKLVYTEIFPRKNEYILNFPPGNPSMC